MDEPDAHLHNNLQRVVINYFLSKNVQFLIATHSEEFIRDIDIHSILSIMSGRPRRVINNSEIIRALSDVDNNVVIRTQESPFILYLEGEDDDRILSEWAKILMKENIYQQYYPFILGGSNKKAMSDRAESHFRALRQIVPEVKRVMILDYDDDSTFHPDEDNDVLREWQRKNIDNYLLVPNAWKRAVADALHEEMDSMFLTPYFTIIDDFFSGQNLQLPPKSTWRDVSADVFRVIDGKKILFERDDSLFNLITSFNPAIKITRQKVACKMECSELHVDILKFFEVLTRVVENS